MSKTSKTKSKEKRRKAKAAAKVIQRAKYESFMHQGKNKKSKRALKRGKASILLVNGKDHPYGKCGNLGCSQCFSPNFKSFLLRGQPKNMPQWMWIRWSKLNKNEKKYISTR